MIEQKKVFISGPMTGLPNNNVDAFYDAELILKEAGFSVFNPAIFRVLEGFTESEIMDIDLEALKHCNYIYQLDGWENSEGANVEWAYAKKCGIDVVNHSWLEWYVKQIRKTDYDPSMVTFGMVG